MSEYELHELAFLALSQMDMNFQFWLSITFAVIVVTYFAAKNLPRRLFAVIAFLYLVTTAILVLRGLLAARMYGQYTSSMHELHFPEGAVDSVFVVLRGTIFIVGTISALAYLYSGYRESEGARK